MPDKRNFISKPSINIFRFAHYDDENLSQADILEAKSFAFDRMVDKFSKLRVPMLR